MRGFCLSLLAFSFSLFTSAQCINTYPYTQDFEANNGGWLSGGTGDDWAWGAVSKPVIQTAYSGSNCWVSGGLTASFYNFSERSYVQSPCFDFSSLQHPVVSVNVFWETEKTYDGAVLQYSINGGTTWINLGSSSDATDCLNKNWFNSSGINNLNGLALPQEGWAGNVQPTSGSCQGGNGSNGWKTAAHCVPYLAGAANVLFRFAFGAGTTCNSFDGFAFDDFSIAEAPSPVGDFTYSCSGSAISFTSTSTQCPNTFTWNFGDGSTATGLAASHTYAVNGNYTVSFTAGGTCYADTTVTHLIQMLSVSTGTINVSCSGGNDGKAFVAATGGSNYTYSWNTQPVQNTDTAFNLSAGNYSVTVSAPGFCDATTTVSVSEPAPLSNTVAVVADTCSGGVGEITVTVSGGTSPYSFIWSTSGSTSNQLSNLHVGNYTATITDFNNCTLSAAADVPYTTGIAVMDSLVENVSCYGTGDGKIIVSISGGVPPYTYQWSNSANTAAINHLATGNYLLTVTDVNNCSAGHSATIDKEYCPSYIYFPTAFSPNGDGVNDFFKPKYSIDFRQYFIRVYNRWGEEVYESSDVNEGWNGVYKGIPQPLSVFVWYADYSFLDGKKHTEAGNVTLVK
jgi:gliding motility-associated-like protein